jgi:hypothetical protein
MTPDEHAKQLYSTLDNACLLSLLLVVRDELERHKQMSLTLMDVVRELGGTRGRPITDIADAFRCLLTDVSAEEVLVVREALRTTGFGEVLDSPDAWQTLLVTYPLDLGRREHWILVELTRRGLLPDSKFGGLDPDVVPHP